MNRIIMRNNQLNEEARRTMVEQWRADDSDFCREAVERGWLTEEQMQRAAERYRLGKSRSGRTIFWMIDEQGVCRDGHIGDSWVSVMLKQRFPENAQYVRAEHCLFGLHFISRSAQSVAIVEEERTAVVMSELFPQYLWMAYGYLANFAVWQFEPLRGHRVVVFPKTDQTGSYYVMALEVADQAHRRYGLDVTVSSVIEDGATEEQKEREIDLLGFLF